MIILKYLIELSDFLSYIILTKLFYLSFLDFVENFTMPPEKNEVDDDRDNQN